MVIHILVTFHYREIVNLCPLLFTSARFWADINYVIYVVK
jgi:hypothetical protein